METYQVTCEPWDESEIMLDKCETYAEALEEACRYLCLSAMYYVAEGYTTAYIYKDGKRVWCESVGIDRW